MRIKADFITNSSSCHYTILKEKLTEAQKILIFNHIKVASFIYPSSFNSPLDESDEWLVSETRRKLHLSTIMNNFNMYEFLIKIGVSPKDIIIENGE